MTAERMRRVSLWGLAGTLVLVGLTWGWVFALLGAAFSFGLALWTYYVDRLM